MLTVRLHLVDGSVMDAELPGSTLEQVRRMKDRGVAGRAIIEQLVSDDIRPPPRFADFSEGGATVRVAY